jgi:acid phosphatase (class A)
MTKKSLFTVIFMGFLCVGAVLPAYALDYVDPQFLTPQLLASPPAEGSKEAQRQLGVVERVQKAVLLSDIDAFKNEQKFRLDLMTEVMGPTFTRDNLPKTFQMLDRVLANATNVVETDKKFFHTRRPYLVDPRVKLYVDPIDKSPAYPSGHTAESLVLAEVLGLLCPSKANALRDHANDIAWHRVLAGVHYPGDIDGGRALAMLMTGALVANDDFQDDLTVAKREIASK